MLCLAEIAAALRYHIHDEAFATAIRFLDAWGEDVQDAYAGVLPKVAA